MIVISRKTTLKYLNCEHEIVFRENDLLYRENDIFPKNEVKYLNQIKNDIHC